MDRQRNISGRSTTMNGGMKTYKKKFDVKAYAKKVKPWRKKDCGKFDTHGYAAYIREKGLAWNEIDEFVMNMFAR